MNELLEFIIHNCSYLYEKYGFRIIDSQYTSQAGGSALIDFEGQNMRIRFIREYRQIFVDFQPLLAKKNDRWYSIDLVNTLVTECEPKDSTMNEANTSFLRTNFSSIIEYFNKDNIDNTVNLLTVIQDRRTKRLWG